MRVIIKTLTEDELKNCDYQGVFIIEIDGHVGFTVADGEPEDNNLGRNFSDCALVPTLMQEAYLAGANGEPFDLTRQKITREEI